MNLWHGLPENKERKVGILCNIWLKVTDNVDHDSLNSLQEIKWRPHARLSTGDFHTLFSEFSDLILQTSHT